MVALSTLWLPIVLSAVIVFIASSIMHMVLPYHRSDYKKLPDEEKVAAAIRAAGVTRGLYMFPFADHKQMKEPAVQEKFKRGPVGTMIIRQSGAINLGPFLAQWFVFCLVVGFFTAYIAAHTVAPGTDYLQVFRVVGAVAFMSYGLGNLANSIWKGEPWAMVAKEVVDGLIYGCLTAGDVWVAVAEGVNVLNRLRDLMEGHYPALRFAACWAIPLSPLPRASRKTSTRRKRGSGLGNRERLVVVEMETKDWIPRLEPKGRETGHPAPCGQRP